MCSPIMFFDEDENLTDDDDEDFMELIVIIGFPQRCKIFHDEQTISKNLISHSENNIFSCR